MTQILSHVTVIHILRCFNDTHLWCVSMTHNLCCLNDAHPVVCFIDTYHVVCFNDTQSVVFE